MVDNDVRHSNVSNPHDGNRPLKINSYVTYFVTRFRVNQNCLTRIIAIGCNVQNNYCQCYRRRFPGVSWRMFIDMNRAYIVNEKWWILGTIVRHSPWAKCWKSGQVTELRGSCWYTMYTGCISYRHTRCFFNNNDKMEFRLKKRNYRNVYNNLSGVDTYFCWEGFRRNFQQEEIYIFNEYICFIEKYIRECEK